MEGIFVPVCIPICHGAPQAAAGPAMLGNHQRGFGTRGFGTRAPLSAKPLIARSQCAQSQGARQSPLAYSVSRARFNPTSLQHERVLTARSFIAAGGQAFSPRPLALLSPSGCKWPPTLCAML
jgi:hypothetical protein